MLHLNLMPQDIKQLLHIGHFLGLSGCRASLGLQGAGVWIEVCHRIPCRKPLDSDANRRENDQHRLTEHALAALLFANELIRQKIDLVRAAAFRGAVRHRRRNGRIESPAAIAAS